MFSNDNYLNLSGLSLFFEKLKSIFIKKEDIDLDGLKGEKGDPGESAGFGTPTATVDNNVGTPSVNVTSSGDNTSKVFNFEFKNLKGDKGDIGERGSNFHWGKMITGTTATGRVFSDSGIESALENDLYINKDTLNIYQCLKGGEPSVAEWAYIGNMKANDQISALPFMTLEVKDDGHLYVSYTDTEDTPTLDFEVTDDGHLLITY